MSIPTQSDTFAIVLGLMDDGKDHSRPQLCNQVAVKFDLSPEELSMKTKSKAYVYKSRVNWGVSYLSRARMVSKVSRGVYRINDKGRKALEDGLTGADFFHYLQRVIAADNPWGQDEMATGDAETDTALSPSESIQSQVEEIQDSLKADILKAIYDLSPDQFETLVVRLLEEMGYGNGQVTQSSNDGGVDGVLMDNLGLHRIYTQAKLYAEEHKVYAPTIDSFAGALHKHNATTGVFITTSSFAEGLMEKANDYNGLNIVLVDGDKLADLLITYDLGAVKDEVITVKRFDESFFDTL